MSGIKPHAHTPWLELLWRADLSYVGCFLEPQDVISTYTDKTKRPLTLIDDRSDMTIELCKRLARDQRYNYAALQAGAQCFGGQDLEIGRYITRDCSTPCTGNSAETCGGPWTNAIYLLTGEAHAPPQRHCNHSVAETTGTDSNVIFIKCALRWEHHAYKPHHTHALRRVLRCLVRARC